MAILAREKVSTAKVVTSCEFDTLPGIYKDSGLVEECQLSPFIRHKYSIRQAKSPSLSLFFFHSSISRPNRMILKRQSPSHFQDYHLVQLRREPKVQDPGHS